MTVVTHRSSLPQFGFKSVKAEGEPLLEWNPGIERAAKFYDDMAERHTKQGQHNEAAAARSTASGIRTGIVDPKDAANHYEMGCNGQNADAFHRLTEG